MKIDFKKEFDAMQSQGWRMMPFGELFKDNAELMEALEKQFDAAPMKPSYRKYFGEEFSDQELEEDLNRNQQFFSSERDARLMELINECDTLHASGKLYKKYYVRDIEQTNIVIQLKAIGKKYDLLKKYNVKHGNADPVSLKTETENTGRQIIEDVNVIEYEPVRKKVVDFILADGENMLLTIEQAIKGRLNEKYEDAGRHDNYKRLKMYFDNYLRENLALDLPTALKNDRLIFKSLKELEQQADRLVIGKFIKTEEKKMLIAQLAAANPDEKNKVKWLGSNPQLICYMTKITENKKRNVAYAKKIFIRPDLQDHDYKNENIPAINKLFR